MKTFLKVVGLLLIVVLAGVAAALVWKVRTEGRNPFPEIRFGGAIDRLPRVIAERLPLHRPEAPAEVPAEAPVREAGPLDAASIAEAFPGALSSHDAETLRRLYALGDLRYKAGDLVAALDAFDSLVRLDPQSEAAQRAFVQIGNIHHRRGEAEAALAAYDKALALRPDDPVALHNRALSLARAGRFDEALDGIRRAADLDPADVATLMHLGNVLLALGRYEEAVDAYRQSIEIDPARAETRYNLGLALHRLGRPAEASEALGEAAARATGPLRLAALSLRGEVFYRRGLFEEAARAYGEAAEMEPETYVHHYNRGVALAKADPIGLLALDAFERARRYAPDDPRIDFHIAALRFARGEDAEAVASWRRGLVRAPNEPAARLSLGYALQRLGRPAEAEAEYRRVIDLADTEGALARLNLGTILEARGETDAALEMYRGGPPDDPLTHYHAGRLLLAGGRTEEAADLFARAAALGGDDPRFSLALAEAHERAGRLAPALAAYAQALERGGAAAPVHLRMGILYARQRRAAEAEAAFRSALATRPDSATRVDALLNLGALLDAAGRTDEAIAAYREAVGIENTRPATYYNLGLLYDRARRYDLAVEAFRTGLRLRPEAALAAKIHTALGVVFHARGLLDEAAREFEEAVLLDRTLVEARFNLRALRGETPAG